MTCDDDVEADICDDVDGVYRGNGTECATTVCVDGSLQILDLQHGGPVTVGNFGNVDMTITWAGDREPSTLILRGRPGCGNEFFACGDIRRNARDRELGAGRTFSEDPIEFPDILGCRVSPSILPLTLDYEAVLIDEDGNESTPFPFTWDCIP